MVFMLPTMLAIPIVAALDDGRYHWLPVSWWVCVPGYALWIMGMVGVTWAESVNKFFETTVRIQTDRGHNVIDSGPYAIVRHPGYVFISIFLEYASGSGFPVGFDSCRSVVPAPCRADGPGRIERCGKSWRAMRNTPSESDIG